MRGTSIFSLPGQLIGAALGRTEQAKERPNKSLWWRVRYQYFIWYTDYQADKAIKDLKAGRYRILRDEHLESLDNYLNLP